MIKVKQSQMHTHLPCMNGFENMGTCFWIMDERVPLRPVDKLEFSDSRLAEN